MPGTNTPSDCLQNIHSGHRVTAMVCLFNHKTEPGFLVVYLLGSDDTLVKRLVTGGNIRRKENNGGVFEFCYYGALKLFVSSIMSREVVYNKDNFPRN